MSGSWLEQFVAQGRTILSQLSNMSLPINALCGISAARCVAGRRSWALGSAYHQLLNLTHARLDHGPPAADHKLLIRDIGGRPHPARPRPLPRSHLVLAARPHRPVSLSGRGWRKVF